MIHQITLDELAARGEVVERTIDRTKRDGTTAICFVSGAFVRITDRPDDHRVEAFAS